MITVYVRSDFRSRQLSDRPQQEHKFLPHCLPRYVLADASTLIGVSLGGACVRSESI